MTTAVDVSGLRMRYGTHDVLHDVTFTVDHGEVLALLGPNGAGKTTTIEILEGFRTRSAGQVSVLGEDPATGGDAWRARVGIVLQSWRDHGRWRVGELLTHFATYYPHPWDVADLLAEVRLAPEKHLRTLSGGQRRRLDVAIGLVGRPDLLFLDEPTTGFDPEARRKFHDLVRALKGHTTILLTTHDLNEAELLADRILILDGGRIVAAGTAAQLADHIGGDDVVRWSRAGQRFTEATRRSTPFVHNLFRRYGDTVEDLEVRRASLEDSYLALVRRAEAS